MGKIVSISKRRKYDSEIGIARPAFSPGRLIMPQSADSGKCIDIACPIFRARARENLGFGYVGRKVLSKSGSLFAENLRGLDSDQIGERISCSGSLQSTTWR